MQGILNNETPIQMGKSGALFGILTRASASREIGVLILNAGLLHHVGPFRLHVLLARLLGERGFTTLRMDQSGKGARPRPGHTPRRGPRCQGMLGRMQNWVAEAPELRA